jgi:hypothetical protein
MQTINWLASSRQVNHSIQVTSFGGTGTTMLYHFLERCGADVPKDSHDWIPWKHQRVPPSNSEVPRGFRALYLFSNPMNAVLSVFRRDYQHWHVERIGGNVDAWDESWVLDDYLAQEDDIFRLADHFHNWTSANRDYPIMLLRFGALWDHLPEVFAFLGLPSSHMTEFPEKEKRRSDWTDEPPQTQSHLEQMYGALSEEIERAPNIEII